jgi:hypothetical protein
MPERCKKPVSNCAKGHSEETKNTIVGNTGIFFAGNASLSQKPMLLSNCLKHQQ